MSLFLIQLLREHVSFGWQMGGIRNTDTLPGKVRRLYVTVIYNHYILSAGCRRWRAGRIAPVFRYS
jgi:hypothetical protein